MHKTIVLFLLFFVPVMMLAQPEPIEPPTKPQTTTTNRSKHKPAKPTTGTLSITSTPSGAAVKINGTFKGETPLTLERQKPGSYSVTFSAEGYESKTQSVSVTAGKTVTCSATLKKKQVQQPMQQQPVPTPATPASSQTFTANSVSFNMIRVEGGTFTIGATSEQGSDAYGDEKPAHQVTLSTYYIAETEVTQELWQAVMGSNPSHFKGANRPVEKVSWDDCQTFIRKLNSLTGKTFRLPTEAEWEYAARGGNKSQGYKHSRSNTLGNVGWSTDNSGSKTHPVKTKSPNELGIYDMSGNVLEWCQDWYGSYSSSSQTNPTGPASGSSRVSRGGSWNDFAGFCRVSSRSSSAPSNRDNNLGFRLVLQFIPSETLGSWRPTILCSPKEYMQSSEEITANLLGAIRILLRT